MIRKPGDDEAEHVGEVVAGVGDKRHRVAEIAEQRLCHDERRVERDADRERRAETRRRVSVATGSVAVTVIVRLGVIVAVVMIVRAVGGSHRGMALRLSGIRRYGRRRPRILLHFRRSTVVTTKSQASSAALRHGF